MGREAAGMTDYIYNEGTSGHRGVWHATEDLEERVHPAKVREMAYSDRTYRIETPEWSEFLGSPMCRQSWGGSRFRTGGTTGGNWSNKPNADGVVVVRKRAERPNVVVSGPPPAPLCSRCARKVGLE